jgi:hypothetical protein
VFSADRDPADRWFDRLLAKLGLLEDAAPLFRDGERVPRAGVLLALPAIAHSGIVEIAREVYGSIGPAFYGLRTPMVALVFLALLRIQRPEVLKEHAPPELGRLLGLDRAPEVKTLRRKLARLAALGRSTELGRQLAARRVQRFTDANGVSVCRRPVSREAVYAATRKISVENRRRLLDIKFRWLLQAVEERDEVVAGAPRGIPHPREPRVLPERLQDVAFHLQVGLGVPTRRGDAFVAEVVADHREIDPSL